MDFWQNEDGNFSIVTALGFVAVFTVATVAVDINGISNQQNKTQNVLDSAALAAAVFLDQNGASSGNVTQAENDAGVYFLEEMQKIGYNCQLDEFEVIFDESEVNATGSCNSRTYFPGSTQLVPDRIIANSSTYYSNMEYEISLMLDLSGSMNSSNRIGALKTSVSEMIETLIPDNGTNNVRIALAPYSSSVNAGLFGGVTTGIPDLYAHTVANLGANPDNILNTSEINQGISNESNQLMAMTNGSIGNIFQQVSIQNPDGTPVTGGVKNGGLNTIVGGAYSFNDLGVGPNNWSSSNWSSLINSADFSVFGSEYAASVGIMACVSEREGPEAFTKKSGMHFPVGSRASQCPASVIQPLSTNKSALLNEIDAMVAGGATAGQIGIAWSWYLIQPNWNSVWPIESKSYAYAPDRHIQRIAILMTDGSFNSVYDNSLGNSVEQSESLCDAMKAEGITIYSVAFSAPASGQAIMQHCASSDTHYFNASNSDDVQAAYQHITRSLSNVRIGK